ncbi:SPOR domain-containing protein [Litoribacter ruber]|uniref:SPOR domain-containing protein n=1 Tax=Litoribacter ruber TaxID=702568 RepID=UPI001BD9E436|nr:SPOR domain-containing protein [Litoribacter ruber]MBT0809664.1 SPOR domain-containing protein [Litoribacter ruber]
MAFRNLLLIICLLAPSALITQQAAAQTRQQQRELRRELRKLSPEEFDSMKNRQAELQQKVEELSRQTSQLQEDVQGKEKQISELKNELSRLQKELDQRKEELMALRQKEEQWNEGVVFRVQIGAFSDYDYSHATGSSPQLQYEKTDDWHKYIMGNFRSYKEADELKKHLRKTGIRDAWIVPYRDGERVPLREVLDEALAD